MTNRMTSSSLPRPRTKSAVFPSMSASSSNIPPPTFKATPPSALLASHNSNDRLSSRLPSFSIHSSSPPASTMTTSTASSTSSSSTQRSISGRLKKPSLGIRSTSSSRQEEDSKRKPLNRKISAPLFRDGEGSEGSKEVISGTSRPGRVEAQNGFTVYSAPIRLNSLRRKPAPVEEESHMSVPPRAPTMSGFGGALSDSESTTGYQRKPPPIPRQRVPSTIAAGPSRTPSYSSASRMQAKSSRASSPPSQTSASSPMPSNTRGFTPGAPSTSRIRTPSSAISSTSYSTPSLPSSQQPAPRTPARSPVRPVQSPSSPIPAPVTSPSRAVRSAPSSVRRLSQIQGHSHSSSPNMTSVASPPTPALPSGVRGQPVQQPPSTTFNTTTSPTPASTRLRTPSLGGFSSLAPSPGFTSPVRRPRTTSTATTGSSNVTAPATTSTSTVRGLRARSVIPPTLLTSNPVPGSTPAQPQTVTIHTSPQTSAPHGSTTSTSSTPSEFELTTPTAARNEAAFLFPRIDSGDESSGSVYSQASASVSVSQKEGEPSPVNGEDLKTQVSEATVRASQELGQQSTPTSMCPKVDSIGDEVSQSVQPKTLQSDSDASSPFTRHRGSRPSPSSSPSNADPQSSSLSGSPSRLHSANPSPTIAGTVGGGGSLTVETRRLGTRSSNSSLRPAGPRNPLVTPKTPNSAPTPETSTGLATFPTTTPGTPGTPSQLPMSTAPTFTPNASFGSLLSHYTSSISYPHAPTDSIGSTTSSQLSPSPSETSTSYTQVSRRIAPAPNSIFGFGTLGSEHSTGSEDDGRRVRGRIPSFSDATTTNTESEKEDEYLESDVGGKRRGEKSMSVGTIRAVDVSESLVGRMRDEDGRTVGDDPGGSRVVNLPTSRIRIVSSPNPAPSSLLTPPLSPPRTSLQPTTSSQNLSPVRESTLKPHSPTSPQHSSPKRHSFVPQKLGTEDMKRLLSKPAVVSGYSSTSDSESCAKRKTNVTTAVASSSRIPPPSPSSPRKRVTSEQSRSKNDEGSTTTAQVTKYPVKKPVVGESNWVAPWEDVHVDGRRQPPSTSSRVAPSLNRKASEDFLTWKKEMMAGSGGGGGGSGSVSRDNQTTKKSRNVLRKPSLRGLSTAAGAGAGADPNVALSGLRPPRPTQSKGRSASPSTLRSANSSSRGNSPTRGIKDSSSSSAARTPAEEIMLAYKQQREREEKIEETFGYGMSKVGADESAKTSREGGQREVVRPIIDAPFGSTTTWHKESTSPSLAPSTTKAEPSTHTLSMTAPQGRNQAERTPSPPSFKLPESTTGQMVAIGSEKDAFLPSFWNDPASKLASQLVIENDDDVSSFNHSQPPPPVSSSSKIPSGVTGRRSLQERRSSLPRPLTVSPPKLNNKISLDRSREVVSPAIVVVDVNSPSAPRSNHSSVGSTSIPNSPGSPGMKASKGGLWNLMKRISAGGLRDRYQPGENDACSPNSPPPVPPLPKSLMPPKVSPSAKLKSPTAFATPIDSYTSRPTKTVKARRSMGEYRPGTSKTQTSSSNSSSTCSHRPSTTTRSSSPVSPSFNRLGDSMTSSSSHGEDLPAVPSFTKAPSTTKLQQHILSPSELSRLQRDFDQEYEQKRRTAPSRPTLTKVPTGSSNSASSRSTGTGPSRPSEEWMIVGTPIDPPAFSLPPPRRDRRNPPSPSRPSTAPAPPTPTSMSFDIPRKASAPQQTLSDDGHGYGSLQTPESRKSLSAISRPSNAMSSRPTAMVFRELPSFKSSVTDGLTEKEKADRWDDLLLKSDLAGGTIHLGAADRLESDALRFSIAESES